MSPFDPNESKQLASRLNHDFGAPVRAIRGFGRFLKKRLEEGKKEEALEFAGLLETEAERLEGMLEGLVTYLRIPAQGQGDPTDGPRVDGNACIQKTREKLRVVLGVELHAETGPIPSLPGPASDWERVFYEIFSNSLKFKDKNRPLELRVLGFETPEGRRIEISDNGTGLPPGVGDRPFALFSRLHDPDQYPGYGIGLAVCARIAASHGARLFFAESKDDWKSGVTLVIEFVGL